MELFKKIVGYIFWLLCLIILISIISDWFGDGEDRLDHIEAYVGEAHAEIEELDNRIIELESEVEELKRQQRY